MYNQQYIEYSNTKILSKFFLSHKTIVPTKIKRRHFRMVTTSLKIKGYQTVNTFLL
jgi:hypothetical protein